MHLLAYVIRPVLKDLRLWSLEAERLVLGTACAESDCGRWLRQKGGGPALGIFQMEPSTHDDLFVNFLDHRHHIRRQVWNWRVNVEADARELIWNIGYATAMCRVHYLRDPEPLPNTLVGQAEYYKRVYNTHLGAGSAEGYIKKWRQFIPSGLESWE